MTAYVDHFDRPYHSAFQRWTAALKASRARHRAYLQTRNELLALSDRELADIGISRAQINSVARDSIA